MHLPNASASSVLVARSFVSNGLSWFIVITGSGNSSSPDVIVPYKSDYFMIISLSRNS